MHQIHPVIDRVLPWIDAPRAIEELVSGTSSRESSEMRTNEPFETDEPVALDAIDRKILSHLQNDARLTNLELAELVGISPNPSWRRVKRLESPGIIQHYVAILNQGQIGLTVTVFIRVSLSSQRNASLSYFEESVAQWPEVMECYLMSGASDYQIRVVVESIAAYERFLREKLMCRSRSRCSAFNYSLTRDFSKHWSFELTECDKQLTKLAPSLVNSQYGVKAPLIQSFS